MIWLMVLMMADESTLPDLAQIFLENRSSELARVLPGDERIQLQLDPLLYDRGNLSRDQVIMSFHKLQKRYVVREAIISNTQSDTNYAWLEVYLQVTLDERKTGLTYFATFSFHYKIIGAQIAIDRWTLQDLH